MPGSFDEAHAKIETAKAVVQHVNDATLRNTIDATLEALGCVVEAIEASQREILNAISGPTGKVSPGKTGIVEAKAGAARKTTRASRG